MKLLAVIIYLTAVAGSSACAASAAPLETIAIHSRHPIPSCAGLCMDLDLTVSSTGEGELRTRLYPDGEDRVTHFRVAPARFEAFRQSLSAIRPAGVAVLPGPCIFTHKDVNGVEFTEDARPGVIPMVIEWSNGSAASRYESCSFLDPVALEALRALRFSVTRRSVVSAEEAAEPGFI